MDMTMTPVAIALLNTVFRLATVIVLFPFIPKIEKLVCWLVKDNKEDLEDEADFDLLEERLLNYPALAHRTVPPCNERNVQETPQKCQQSYEPSE